MNHMLKDKRDEFVRNAICRSIPHRQKKAGRIFAEIRSSLTVEKAWEISVEWKHYLMGEMTPDQFAECISNLLEDEVN